MRSTRKSRSFRKFLHLTLSARSWRHKLNEVWACASLGRVRLPEMHLSTDSRPVYILAVRFKPFVLFVSAPHIFSPWNPTRCIRNIGSETEPFLTVFQDRKSLLVKFKIRCVYYSVWRESGMLTLKVLLCVNTLDLHNADSIWWGGKC
jgi:hypothetical protein